MEAQQWRGALQYLQVFPSIMSSIIHPAWIHRHAINAGTVKREVIRTNQVAEFNAARLTYKTTPYAAFHLALLHLGGVPSPQVFLSTAAS
jgi:hypothetical protein